MTSGGPRPGSGRTARYGIRMVTVTIRLTPGQKARLEALGGGAWVREQLGPVEEPDALLVEQLALPLPDADPANVC